MEPGTEKKGIKRSRSSDSEAGFVFVQRNPVEDNAGQLNKDEGYTMVDSIDNDVIEEKFEDMSDKLVNNSPVEEKRVSFNKSKDVIKCYPCSAPKKEKESNRVKDIEKAFHEAL